MPHKILSLFVLLSTLFTAQAQPKNNFKLRLINNSPYTTSCTILGNDKVDSVGPGQTRTIVFTLLSDQVSFYLNLWTSDVSKTSYQNKLIRVLPVTDSRQVIITKENQLQFPLTASEKTIASYKPQLRTKNFWRLDSVITANANDIAGAEIIFLSICDIDVKEDTIKKYYEFLTPRIRNGKFGRQIVNYLEARGSLHIGNKMKNFKLPDTTGKSISLYDIKSDYILLDFWFSRCAPCIKSFPELQELYSKTDRSKLEIIGISIDQPLEKTLWKITIAKHNLSWLNLHDPKAVLASSFAIVNYPTKVLLDKDKKVVMVDTDNSYSSFYQEVEKLVKERFQ
jgi:peroxiredoxin